MNDRSSSVCVLFTITIEIAHTLWWGKAMGIRISYISPWKLKYLNRTEAFLQWNDDIAKRLLSTSSWRSRQHRRLKTHSEESFFNRIPLQTIEEWRKNAFEFSHSKNFSSDNMSQCNNFRKIYVRGSQTPNSIGDFIFCAVPWPEIFSFELTFRKW